MRLHERSVHGARPERAHPAGRLPLHPARRPALPAPVRLAVRATCTCPGWPGKVEYAQFLHDASEIKRIVNDPHRTAQNTTMGGVSPDTLTLKLPIQKPNVLVPVIELFL